MYNCFSEDNRCCDKDDNYKGCCSDPAINTDLGPGNNETVVGQPAITTPTTQGESSLARIISASTMSTFAIPQNTTATASTGEPAQQHPRTSPAAVLPTLVAPVASSDSREAEIGIGAGVPLGVTVIAAFFYIIYSHSRGRRMRRDVDARQTPYDHQVQHQVPPPMEQTIPHLPELHAQSRSLSQSCAGTSITTAGRS